MSWYPEMEGERSSRRVLAVAVAAAVVVVLAALGVRMMDADERAADGGASPAADDDPAEVLPATADVPTTSTTGGPSEAEDVATLAGQVADVRSLALLEPVAVEFVPGEDLRSIVRAEVEGGDGGATGDPGTRTRLLETLLVVPRGEDLGGVLGRIQDSEAVGLYLPSQRRLLVRQDSDVAAVRVRWAAAHELVHALQDQHSDIESLLDQPAGSVDRELAALALLEGDAVITQEAWARRFMTAADRQELGTPSSVPAGALSGRQPGYVVERFSFPYVAGARFAAAVIEAEGIDALSRALERPPTTTAEILEPERYLAGLDPAEVSVSGEPGDGWTAARDDELGAFDLQQLLRPVGERRAAELVLGWNGGRIRSWERGDRVAASAVVAFTSEAAARALCEALPGWWRVGARAEDAGPGLLRSDDGWLATTCDGLEVRFAVAPDEGLVRRLVPPAPAPSG
jgi:hypothetical protein